DIAKMAAGAGITTARTVKTLEELEQALADASKKKGLSYLVLKLEPGTVRYPLEKRKISDGIEDKYNFLRHVERLEKIIIKPPCEQK
ncbi:MAG: thiamine pyrophosphate-binding protein, partial [Thermodesulfobacteriota bacterium]